MSVPPFVASAETRVDLHLHSRASTDTGSWFLSQALMPESFTEPDDAYRTAKRRGMDFVTLTDHNTISGALEIAHHSDVVVGVEITATFPDDGVPVHVLAWGVDESAWDELSRLRPNLYELVDDLCARGVPHALAHPLHRVGDRLTADHLERCLLLFTLWEGRNGARPESGNTIAERIARSATPEYLAKLADKHGLAPRGDGPPALTGGSDDHALLGAASTWTCVPRARTAAELLGNLRAGRVEPGGQHGSAQTLAHAVGSLAVKGYVNGGAHELPANLRDGFAELIMHRIPAAPVVSPDRRDDPRRGLATGLAGFAMSDPRRALAFHRITRRPDSADRSHARLRTVVGWLHDQALATALDPRGMSVGELQGRIGAFLAAGALVAPYALASRYVRGEHQHAEQIEAEFFGAPTPTDIPPRRVAMLTDTYDELNGVAGTMRRLVDYTGADPIRRPITVITAGDRALTSGPLRRLRSAATVPVPAYGDAGWNLGVPSLLDVLDAVEESRAQIIHAATPGPIGLAGLLIARVLGLPFVATHHTEFADYAQALTSDRLAASVARSASSWFYSHAERIYLPTRASGAGLLREGIDPTRTFIFGRGVDTELFGPTRRSWTMRQRLAAGRNAVVVLYVGRLSREKGLDTLAAAFRRASETCPQLRLAIVGDGPHRDALAGQLAGTAHRFLGPLSAAPLAAAYASADVFCLPSATETFGQVVLEAATSGLAPIVTDTGGAQDQVEHGVTGLVTRAGDVEELARELVRLASEPGLRAALGQRARAAAIARAGWTEVFDGLLASYNSVGSTVAAAHAAVDTTAAAA